MRRARRWRKLAVLALSTLAALVLAELLFRGWRAARGLPFSRAAAEDAFRRALGEVRETLPLPGEAAPAEGAEAPDRGLALHPFFGFDREDRNPEIEAELAAQARAAPGERFVILVVGGSVAEIFARIGSEPLARELSSDARLAGKRVTVLDHACGGHKQPQQLGTVAYLFALGLEPDAVINIDGFNEVALANYNARHGVHPLHPSLSHWGYLVGARVGRRGFDHLLALRAGQRAVERLAGFGLRHGWLSQSAIGGSALLALLERQRARVFAAHQGYAEALASAGPEAGLVGPRFDAEGLERFQGFAAAWFEASRDLAALCRARGIPYLHVLQPTLHDRDSKKLTLEELKTGAAPLEWAQGVLEGYPLLRARAADLASAGVAFLDASMIFKDVETTLYYDNCHFGQEGNELLARHVAAALLALPW